MGIPPTPRPERLTYDDLRKEVVEFVSGFMPDEYTIPVDVEWIADVRLALDIIPVPGLQRDRDIDAYLSADRTSIYVDDGMCGGPILNRFRFTLAHELAHWYLHEDLYESAAKAGWGFSEFIKAIPEEDWAWYEWQARCFAGLLLVPREPLATAVAAVAQFAASKGFAQLDLAIDAHRTAAADWIAPAFQVSPSVILLRGGYDGLWPKNG